MCKTISSELIYKSFIFRLFKQKIELPGGNVVDRDIIKTKSAVAILAVNDANKVLFVKQYRPAIEIELIELPAGLIDDGEEPAEAALRELEEETGYRAERVEKLTEFYTSPGFSDCKIHIFRAFNLKKTEQSLDEDEVLEVLEIDAEECKNTVFEDGKTVTALKFL